MADGKAGEEKPEKSQRAGAAGGPEEAAEKPVKTKTVSSSNGGESSSRSAEKRSAEEEAVDLPAKPTKISKFGFAIGSQTTKKASATSIKLGSSNWIKNTSCTLGGQDGRIARGQEFETSLSKSETLSLL
uniref:PEST proteolytic signal-containing nuclear protein n=1 Tax=Microcebus murinus TaxID=30608 RepID=A0A8C5VTS9_MICMU